MFKPEEINLAVLNISSWVDICPDASHYYGKLVLISDAHLSVMNIGVNRFHGVEIEIKKFNDEANRPKKIINQFKNIDELFLMGYEELRKLKLNVDFISLFKGEFFEHTKVMLEPQLNNKCCYKVDSKFGTLVDRIPSYEEAIDYITDESMVRLGGGFSNIPVKNYEKIFNYLGGL